MPGTWDNWDDNEQENVSSQRRNSTEGRDSDKWGDWDEESSNRNSPSKSKSIKSKDSPGDSGKSRAKQLQEERMRKKYKKKSQLRGSEESKQDDGSEYKQSEADDEDDSSNFDSESKSGESTITHSEKKRKENMIKLFEGDDEDTDDDDLDAIGGRRADFDAPIRIESLGKKNNKPEERDDLAMMMQMMKKGGAKKTGWGANEGEEASTPKDQREDKAREEDCEVEEVDDDELPESEKKGASQPLFSARKESPAPNPTTSTSPSRRGRRPDDDRRSSRSPSPKDGRRGDRRGSRDSWDRQPRPTEAEGDRDRDRDRNRDRDRDRDRERDRERGSSRERGDRDRRRGSEGSEHIRAARSPDTRGREGRYGSVSPNRRRTSRSPPGTSPDKDRRINDGPRDRDDYDRRRGRDDRDSRDRRDDRDDRDRDYDRRESRRDDRDRDYDRRDDRDRDYDRRSRRDDRDDHPRDYDRRDRDDRRSGYDRRDEHDEGRDERDSRRIYDDSQDDKRAVRVTRGGNSDTENSDRDNLQAEEGQYTKPFQPAHLPPMEGHQPHRETTAPLASSTTDDDAYKVAPLRQLDLRSMADFVRNPAPKNVGVIQCYIKRTMQKGKKKKSVYHMYFQEGDDKYDGKQFVLFGKKMPKNRTSNYRISLEEDTEDYMGKLRARSTWGTEFVIYDDGVNPKEAENANGKKVRQEYGVVMYETNVLGSRGPRKMHVAVPEVARETGEHKEFFFDELPAKFKNEDDPAQNGFMTLINKPPTWNESVGAHTLDFRGRVTQSSVKNFQLVDERNQEEILMQFGRVDKDVFTLDFQHPFSAYQAFAVALSSFDSKLGCE
jgi:hypothetical protein